MGLLSLIFPKTCFGCGRIGTYFCGLCKKKVVPICVQRCVLCGKASYLGRTHPSCERKEKISGLYGVFRYLFPLTHFLAGIKYRLVKEAENDLTHLLNDHLPSEVPLWGSSPLFCPIPLHRKRYLERGFNQAEAVSIFLSQKYHGVSRDLLRREKKGTPQALVDNKEKRRQNMRGVFEVDNTVKNNHSSIVLVDDVTTTGATIEEATKTLIKAGYKKIYGIVVAKAGPD